jgi:hypothetical protein
LGYEPNELPLLHPAIYSYISIYKKVVFYFLQKYKNILNGRYIANIKLLQRDGMALSIRKIIKQILIFGEQKLKKSILSNFKTHSNYL